MFVRFLKNGYILSKTVRQGNKTGKLQVYLGKDREIALATINNMSRINLKKLKMTKVEFDNEKEKHIKKIEELSQKSQIEIIKNIRTVLLKMENVSAVYPKLFNFIEKAKNDLCILEEEYLLESNLNINAASIRDRIRQKAKKVSFKDGYWFNNISFVQVFIHSNTYKLYTYDKVKDVIIVYDSFKNRSQTSLLSKDVKKIILALNMRYCL